MSLQDAGPVKRGFELIPKGDAGCRLIRDVRQADRAGESSDG